MPPKAKYTREEIVQIALDLVSEKGIGALNAVTLAPRWGLPPDRYSPRSRI